MNKFKEIVFTVWAIWMIILVGIMLFASGPIDIDVVNPVAGAWIFYGLTFGLPITLLAILKLERK